MRRRFLSQKTLLRLLFPAVALAVSLILLSPLIIPPGIPFQGDETYYIPWTIATLQHYNLQAWTSGKGPSTDVLSLVPTLALVGLRGLLGQDFGVKTYLLFMAWLSGLIPYFSIKRLLKHWRFIQTSPHLELASGVGGLVYLLFFNNQATIAGSNSFVWDYAFFPILVSALIIFLDTGKIRELLVFGTASILASPQPFWPFLVGIVGAAYIIFSLVQNHRLPNLVKIAKNSSLAIGIALAFSAFWIVPIFAGYLQSAGSSFQLYTAQRLITPEDLSFLSFWSLSDVLLIGETAHYFFWNHPTNYSLLSISIPLLAMASVLAYRRNPRVLFVGITLLLGALMTAGANEPLGFVYYLIARNLPYGAGAILRNPTKFVPIVTFSYSLLLGLSIIPASYEIVSIGKAARSVLKKNLLQSPRLFGLNSRSSRSRVLVRMTRKPKLRIPKVGFVHYATAVGLIILVLAPITYGTILDLQAYTWPRYHPTTVPQRYTQLDSWLAQQAGNPKVMWFPSAGAYDWKPYDVTGFPDLLSSTPSVAFNRIYPSPLNSTQYIGRILAFMGVQYVIYHNDSIVYPDGPFIQGLLRQRDLSILQSFNDTFTPSDSSQNPLPVGTPGTQFSDSPFHLSVSKLLRGQTMNLTIQYQIPRAVVDQGFFGQFWDGFGILIHGFPSGSVDLSNRIFYATVARQNMTSATTGSALFSGVGVPIKYPESSIDLYANFYDGSYRPLTPLFFVARLSIIPSQLTNQYIIFRNMDFDGSVFAQNVNVTYSPNTPSPLTGNSTTLFSSPASIINFEQVSNVEFRVTAESSAPFVLVLTEPYDRLWRAHLAGIELLPTPVFGLANGFIVNQTGTLTIRIVYTLQNYLNLGIMLSTGTLGGSLMFLIFLQRRNRRGVVQSSKVVATVAVPAEWFDLVRTPSASRFSRETHGSADGRRFMGKPCP